MERSFKLTLKKGGIFCFLTKRIDLKNSKIKSSSPDVWKEILFNKIGEKILILNGKIIKSE
jgi:hypothetical protein